MTEIAEAIPMRIDRPLVPSVHILRGDSAAIPLADASVDLVFTSPPYEDARLYAELGFKVRGQDWVDWAVARFIECQRVCRGVVAWVIEGKTRNYRWSATPALFMADLHRWGVQLRKPPVFHRVGIPGSGGPDWLRNDYEFIVCATNGKLPWSDNTALGKPCVYPTSGIMSNRHQDGRRKNARNGVRGGSGRPASNIANPGNVVRCKVGGGMMGDDLAHENEAPFPESLADFFIRSFCPPQGIVLDPHCGSGSTIAAAVKAGRNGIGMDIRESQCDLTRRRLAGALESLRNSEHHLFSGIEP